LKFKVGDKVKVKNKFFDSQGWTDPSVEQLEGVTLEIVRIESAYTFPIVVLPITRDEYTESVAFKEEELEPLIKKTMYIYKRKGKK